MKLEGGELNFLVAKKLNIEGPFFEVLKGYHEKNKKD
jgi:hypothetical protein